MTTARGRIDLEIVPVKRDHGRVHASATAAIPGGEAVDIFYAIDEYASDALVESADPFVVAALPLAMRRGYDLRVVGGAVSPSLLDTLERFQEVWHDWHRDPMVDVVAEEERERDARPAVAVSTFSGGVDSSFTVYRHTQGLAHRDRKLQAAVMLHGVDIPRVNSVGFIRASARSRRLVNSVGLELVTVQTNVWEVVEARRYPIGAGLASALHLLGGRFGTGLIPGTTSYRHLVFPLGSSPVSDELLSSRSFEVVHDGAREERFDKLRHLANWDEALDLLRVCLADPQHHRNCGHCQKCMLAILTFRVLDVTPRCFETLPSEAAILEWVPTLSSHAVYVQEAETLVGEATARGINDPWVRALRRTVQIKRTKQSIRAMAPVWSRRVATAHSWANKRVRYLRQQG